MLNIKMKIAISGVGLIEDIAKHKSLDLSQLPHGVRTLTRVEELALCTAHKAIENAKLSIPDNSSSTGLVLGVDEAIDDYKTRFFCELLSEGAEGVSPLLFPFTSPNAITAQVSIVFGIKGENVTIANGFLSSGKAIAYSIDILRLKKAKTVVTGGVSPACAAILILEDFNVATKRKARVYGEITGYGETSTGCHDHAINIALNEAGQTFEEVDCFWVNDNAGNIPKKPLPIKIFNSNDSVSFAKSVIDSLLTMNGKTKVITISKPFGGSLSLVIK